MPQEEAEKEKALRDQRAARNEAFLAFTRITEPDFSFLLHFTARITLEHRWLMRSAKRGSVPKMLISSWERVPADVGIYRVFATS